MEEKKLCHTCIEFEEYIEFKLICFLVKNCNNGIFSALQIFLIALLSESKNGPVSKVWIIRAASK